jgi:hypothetical protein
LYCLTFFIKIVKVCGALTLSQSTMNEENMKRGTGVPTPVTSGGPVRPLWITLLAVVGILAVIVALGIGILQLAGRGTENIRDAVTDLGGLFMGRERVVLTTEEWTINSGETVEITFEHRGRRADAVGRYEIEFGKVEGVTATLNGEGVALGEAIDLGEEVPTVLAVSVQTTKERYTDLTIAARFVSEAETVQSTATLTVVNMAIEPRQVPEVEERPVERPEEEQAEEPAPQEVAKEPVRYITVKRYVGRISDPLGTADLHVRVTSVGFDDEGRFRAQERIRVGDRAVVSFTITNMGTKETGAWIFSAFLPVGEGYHLRSKPQPTLLPGDRMEYTLSFEDIREGNRVPLYIHADPMNTLRELSELNNVAEAVFRVVR